MNEAVSLYDEGIESGSQELAKNMPKVKVNIGNPVPLEIQF